ncbi:MAG: hypothetical protein ACK55I_34030, partial [bacterium]
MHRGGERGRTRDPAVLGAACSLGVAAVPQPPGGDRALPRLAVRGRRRAGARARHDDVPRRDRRAAPPDRARASVRERNRHRGGRVNT